VKDLKISIIHVSVAFLLHQVTNLSILLIIFYCYFICRTCCLPYAC